MNNKAKWKLHLIKCFLIVRYNLKMYQNLDNYFLCLVAASRLWSEHYVDIYEVTAAARTAACLQRSLTSLTSRGLQWSHRPHLDQPSGSSLLHFIATVLAHKQLEVVMNRKSSLVVKICSRARSLPHRNERTFSQSIVAPKTSSYRSKKMTQINYSMAATNEVLQVNTTKETQSKHNKLKSNNKVNNIVHKIN